MLAQARLGLLDQPYVQNTSAYRALISSPEHEAVALEAAHKAIVLLQNFPDASLDNNASVLPLSLDLSSVAVLGPNADQPQCGDYAAGGSWGADNCGGG